MPGSGSFDRKLEKVGVLSVDHSAKLRGACQEHWVVGLGEAIFYSPEDIHATPAQADSHGGRHMVIEVERKAHDPARAALSLATRRGDDHFSRSSSTSSNCSAIRLSRSA